MQAMKRLMQCLPLFFSFAPAMANTLAGQLSIETGQSDNGRKAPADQIDERQDAYLLELRGDYQNSYMDAKADYSASQRHFDQGSQEDKSYLNGDSYLRLGNERQPADLLISYSRRTLLQKPDEVRLTNNLEERGILQVAPSLRAKLGNRDTLGVTGEYTDISYQENSLRDSKREGANLHWDHLISALSQLQILAQKADVTFDETPTADYSYSKAAASYSAQLRQLTYSIQLGYNRTESDYRENFNAPSYQIDLDLDTGLNSIQASASKLITDSSIGDGNRGATDAEPASDGSLGINQLERVQYDINWTTQMVCERCRLFAGVTYIEDDYITILERANQQAMNMGFSYQFSRLLSLTVSGNKSQRKFEKSIIGTDYDLVQYQLSLDARISEKLSARLVARREERSGIVEATNYQENFIGINAIVNF